MIAKLDVILDLLRSSNASKSAFNTSFFESAASALRQAVTLSRALVRPNWSPFSGDHSAILARHATRARQHSLCSQEADCAASRLPTIPPVYIFSSLNNAANAHLRTW